MNEQEKKLVIDNLVAIRSEGLTLDKKLLALSKAHGDLKYRFTICLAKLDAFDAAITMQIDSLRDEP